MPSILIVDDEPDIRASYREAFQRRGFTVREARNGETALAELDCEAPDVVLLDILMPDSEGIETLREMKRRHPAVPVCVMSGGGRFGHFDFLEIAKDFGAAGALRKPAGMAAMMAMIDEALGKSG